MAGELNEQQVTHRIKRHAHVHPTSHDALNNNTYKQVTTIRNCKLDSLFADIQLIFATSDAFQMSSNVEQIDD